MSRSTKPYLIRALHQWCIDQDYIPYIKVWVDEHADVPNEYVENNEIILNVSYDATRDLVIHNESISFSARFNGVVRKIAFPIGNVISIFARETGEGMEFEVELTEAKVYPRPVSLVTDSGKTMDEGKMATEQPEDNGQGSRPTGRPTLRIVK